MIIVVNLFGTNTVHSEAVTIANLSGTSKERMEVNTVLIALGMNMPLILLLFLMIMEIFMVISLSINTKVNGRNLSWH
jgi:hypothetical protein